MACSWVGPLAYIRHAKLLASYAFPLTTSFSSTGTSRIRTEAVIHDVRDDTTAQFLEMNVTTFCCCAGLGSFYNASGDVQGSSPLLNQHQVDPDHSKAGPAPSIPAEGAGGWQ